VARCLGGFTVAECEALDANRALVVALLPI
jgi:hypothetical protein